MGMLFSIFFVRYLNIIEKQNEIDSEDESDDSDDETSDEESTDCEYNDEQCNRNMKDYHLSNSVCVEHAKKAE